MPLILGTNSIKETGYEVDNSLRFNSASTNQLYRVTTAGSDYKGTFSAWVKKTTVGVESFLLYAYYNGSNKHVLNFYQDQIYINLIVNASTAATVVTSRLFRDVSAWYHFVVAWDTTQGTASDRIKVYVNGVQETSFSTANYPSQNTQIQFNRNTSGVYVGGQAGSNNFDGYMSEVVYIDGSALDPTSFGEFDSASPNIWKPKDVSGLTFGTNGFYCEFKQSGTSQNSSGLGADTSGNDNHLASQNLTSVAQSIDTCTNNGLTLNPLASNSSYAFSDGNLTLGINNVNDEEKMIPATFGASSGKWYWEVKNTSSTRPNYIHAGYGTDEFISNYINGSQSTSNYVANNGYWNGIQGRGDAANGVSITRAGTGSKYDVSNTFLQNSIAMFAIDLDNRKGWVGLDGTWINDSSGNTGDPSSGANPTWDSNDLLSTDKIWIPTMTGYYAEPTCSLNFGSPPYSVSSSNSDGDGVGNYEYTVPTGFKTWNTKNLAEFG